jgi:aspartyl aminopeptidase
MQLSPVADDLLAFIDASPTPFHAVQQAAARLAGQGFAPVSESESDSLPPSGVIVRGGSLIAWRVGGGGPQAGFRVLGAHTDSPNLRIKPRPDTGSAGFRQLGVEPYGGLLANTWLDRDLVLAGRVVVERDGLLAEHLVRLDDPVIRIPQLAIHLDGDIRENGLKLNAQDHLSPVLGPGEPQEGAFRSLLADAVGVADDAIRGWDIMCADRQPAARIGSDTMLSAPRIDNLASCHAAVRALGSAAASEHTAVICLFDHEEVGSVSAAGAAGSLLAHTLERIARTAEGGRSAYLAALTRSLCISADGAHATHPNYADRHEPSHRIELNAGPVLKRNVNQRYATDGSGHAVVTAVAERVSVPLQQFVTRSDLPCGSTIGPVTSAQLGMVTVDLGIPQLAMHSIRELCGADDPAMLVTLLEGVLAESSLPRPAAPGSEA